MALIILQPFGNKDGREHYLNTIEMKVPISSISKFFSKSFLDNVNDYYTTKEIPIWGVTPGVNNVNVKKWDRVEPGSIVLFSANRRISIIGTVVYKINNSDAAKFLWGINENDQTWENMYFLDELKNVDIPVEEFNRAVGYSANYIIQGFNVLDEEKSEKFLTEFDLYSESVIERVDETEYYNALEEFETLDKSIVTNARKEQYFLRRELFGTAKNFICGICGQTYPINFLIAAHIKKRSLCSLDEKKDWKNIVMPMCKFGCDDLYEKGYINVDNGIVKSVKIDSTDLNTYLKYLNGKKCNYWNDNTKKYFEFHNRMVIE